MRKRFFFNLTGFNNGIDLSDQAKFDFLCYEDSRLFEFSAYIEGFQKVREEYNQPACTCTEFNLRNLFEKYPKEKVIVNHSFPLNAEKKEQFFGWYRDGYLKALPLPIQEEIGFLYDSLDINKKVEILSLFSKYCIKHSFFEGFATKNCFYVIGYIQAFLLKAQKELMSIQYIGLDSNASSKEEIEKPSRRISPATKSNKGLIQVSDESSMSEIYTIWSILIENAEEFGSPINSKEELNFLLGHLFYCKDFKFGPKKSFDLKLFGAAHRDLIDFLMRLSKKINNNKLTNEVYCKRLMQMLEDVYKNVDSVETLSKNWANNNKIILKKITSKLNINSAIYLTTVMAVRKGNLKHLLSKSNN